VRSPTLTTSGHTTTGSSNLERSSTSSDSGTVGGSTDTDHIVVDRHSTDDFTSKVSLPRGMTASSPS